MDTNFRQRLLDPRTTVVIVVDKQAGYFDPHFVAKRNAQLSNNHKQALVAIDSFIAAARHHNVEVIWTQMVENIDESPDHIADKMRSDGTVRSITKLGDPSFEMYGDVLPAAGEKVITKYYYDAFAHTDLSDYLQQQGIQTCIFVGGYATRCILSSVVGANNNGIFSAVARDLVLNQLSAEAEIPTLYALVDTILGQTFTPDEILAVWGTPSR